MPEQLNFYSYLDAAEHVEEVLHLQGVRFEGEEDIEDQVDMYITKVKGRYEWTTFA